MNTKLKSRLPVLTTIILTIFVIALALWSGFHPRPDFNTIDTNAPQMAWWHDSMKTHDQRIAWWREARFGMFIHFGVYSGLGGTWQGQQVKGYAEHIQRILKIPVPIYREQVAGKFNPSNFNADEWVRLAHDAGMGYI